MMIQSVKSLCDTLHLTTSEVDDKQLSALKTWCHTHISEDKQFADSSEEQYSQYIALAKDYLEKFIPLAQDNLTTPVAQFENLTAIQYAAKCGYHYSLENLSIPADNFNQANQYGMTPLHVSASLGFVRTVRALLAKGANPKALNQRQQYPILFALFIPIQYETRLVQHKKDIFNMLTTAAPDTLKAQDEDGETVLHWMAETAVFCDLLEKTIKQVPELVFVKNLAFHYPIHTAILNGQTQVAQLLLNINQVANLEDGRGRTPLHYAARYGNHDMVERCIQATSDLNKPDSEGKTPLLTAAEVGNIEALECLIEHKTNTMATDDQGFSILHHAVYAQHEMLTRWLIANVSPDLLHLTDSSNHTPLHYARENNNSILEALLVSKEGGNGLKI